MVCGAAVWRLPGHPLVVMRARAPAAVACLWRSVVLWRTSWAARRQFEKQLEVQRAVPDEDIESILDRLAPLPHSTAPQPLAPTHALRQTFGADPAAAWQLAAARGARVVLLATHADGWCDVRLLCDERGVAAPPAQQREGMVPLEVGSVCWRVLVIARIKNRSR